MTYDFDLPIERHGTGAYKYDVLGSEFGNPDAIPMWVADMEFACPPFIVEALKQRLEHPIFGYTMTPKAMWQAIIWWQQHRHGWHVEREWLTFIPGIVRGIAYVVNIFTQAGDKIMVQPPVYHPFHHVPQAYGREVVFSPLVERADGLYDIDFERFERDVQGCRIFILCNPHNPGGICWSPDVLRRIADICSRHDVLVISDEIHADMALFGHRHTPFATVSPEAAQCSITFGAPSKVFNMPGIVCSYAIVPNPQLRERFFGWLGGAEYDEPSIMSGIAMAAAYTPAGDEWRTQMLAYVEDNIRLVEDYCREHFTRTQSNGHSTLLVRPIRPEASFLVWLDCRALGLPQAELVDFFIHQAGLALNDGAMFGQGGEGYMRMNVACTRATLQQALDRLRIAVERHEETVRN